jgi:hypothetical protein
MGVPDIEFPYHMSYCHACRWRRDVKGNNGEMGEGRGRRSNKNVWPIKRRMELKGSGIEETEAQQETANLFLCESCNCKPKRYFYVFPCLQKKSRLRDGCSINVCVSVCLCVRVSVCLCTHTQTSQRPWNWQVKVAILLAKAAINRHVLHSSRNNRDPIN